VAIAVGPSDVLALRNDGTVTLSRGVVPETLTNVVALASSTVQNLALRADGTVVAWGNTNVPASLSNVVALATAGNSSLASFGLPKSVPLGSPGYTSNGFSVSLPTEWSRVYALEYKTSLTDSQWTALPLVAGNGSSRTLTDPTAAGQQRFYRVRRW
jgi:hypothetical protein